MCSISRDPRREDHTTWTATAPDAVFTVRTYATRRDYEPRFSAQIRPQPAANLQLTPLRPSGLRSGDKTQVHELMACTAAYSGLRQGELFALTAGQIDPAARVIARSEERRVGKE